MSVQGRRPYRPLLHFTPRQGWINDPNGLIFDGERYHLFAQHYPEDTKWGPMHWLHAVSDDLIHWQELPIALRPDELGTIYSGSAAMIGGKMALMYTSHGTMEQQSVAFSEDFLHFEKYAGNPVLPNAQKRDYRDPKLFWNEKHGRYGVSVAAGDRVEFHVSEDLIHWRKTGEFSDQTRVPGTHECPDLVKLPRPDGGEAYMLVCSMIWDGSRTQYVLGDFDGDRFTLTEPFDGIEYMDKGWDCYAPVSFWGVKEPLFIGWGSNWRYAQKLPEGDYAGMMTLPRVARLVSTPAGTRLGFSPAPQAEACFAEPVAFEGEAALPGETFRIRVCGNGPFEVRLFNRAGEELIVRRTGTDFEIDRSRSGEFGEAQALLEERYGTCAAPIRLAEDGDMELIFDVCVLEAFADGGVFTATNLVFPTSPYERVSVKGARAELSALK